MSRNITYGAIASILALTVVGCARYAAAPTPALPVPEPAEVPLAPQEEWGLENRSQVQEGYAVQPTPGLPRDAVERLVIREASLDLVVPDTQAALDEIGDLVDELGGYTVESSAFQHEDSYRASVTIRVPAESLDLALERIRDLATEVRSERTSGQDVTQEYVDLESRLRHLEATEARLLEFLEEAEDTEAALAVFQQLRQVQAEIEGFKGRVQYLEQSAAMATIRIEITPDELAQPIQAGGWRPLVTLRDALEKLIRVLQFLADAGIVVVVLVIPVLAVVAVPFVGLFFLVRALVRRRRARKAD